MVKISHPRFIVHGTKGSFIKYGIDKQESFLKSNIMPGVENFGVDDENDYGTISYIDNEKDITKKVPTLIGDYGKVYDCMYESIKNGKNKLVSDEELMINMEILEKGFLNKGPYIIDL